MAKRVDPQTGGEWGNTDRGLQKRMLTLSGRSA